MPNDVCAECEAQAIERIVKTAQAVNPEDPGGWLVALGVELALKKGWTREELRLALDDFVSELPSESEGKPDAVHRSTSLN